MHVLKTDSTVAALLILTTPRHLRIVSGLLTCMQVTTRIDGLTFTQVAEKRSLMLSQTEGGKGFFRDPSNKAFFAVNCDMAICFTRET